MTETCLPIVNWPKNWFTSKDEDYKYNISSSNYNPQINSTITITVIVTDGSDNAVANHSFTINANGTDVSLTTDSNGVATYTYTCSSWGVCRFSIGTFCNLIYVTGWKTVGITNGVLYVNEAERICHLYYRKTHNFTNTAWATIDTVSQIATYPPVSSDNFAQTGNKTIISRVYSNGQIQAQASASGSQLVFFSMMWHY